MRCMADLIQYVVCMLCSNNPCHTSLDASHHHAPMCHHLITDPSQHYYTIVLLNHSLTHFKDPLPWPLLSTPCTFSHYMTLHKLYKYISKCKVYIHNVHICISIHYSNTHYATRVGDIQRSLLKCIHSNL